MPRYRITVEYDGTPFVGWQVQINGRSVSGTIAEALAQLTGNEIAVYGAGRTDSGVHALAQVAHFDLEAAWDPLKLRDGLNACVRPHPIAILHAAEVSEDFHARYSAIGRHYVYRIVNRRAPLALEGNRAWHVSVPLDALAMQEAAHPLVGRHDFTTFRSTECQAASAVKTLNSLTVTQQGDLIEITASARSFLHNQVRSMVGSLKFVGEGKWRASDLMHALEARDRSACGPVAPPHGLYLQRVDYGDPK
ncbi:MAG TPA: tRNA pseudouridine(38-40) synthase TruA [Aestuariivirgaceae bacterium]|jgi:tRNA pseudouridine38-40 synthase